MDPSTFILAGVEKTGEIAAKAAKEMASTFDKRVVPGKISEVIGKDVGKYEISNKEIDFDKRIDVRTQNPENLFSTYDERLSHCPTQDCEYGKWDGLRGESIFRPSSEESITKLKEFGQSGIEYRNGIPDFAKVSIQDVKIDMTSNREPFIDSKGKQELGNFQKADIACANEWNKILKDGKSDWSREDVAQYRKDNKITIHECNDRETCSYIPTEIHKECRHLGGVGECKRSELMNGGFDN